MSRNFRRILVTTDLSDDAARAFPRVAEMAREAGAEVTLLHVVPDVIIPPPAGVPVTTPLHAPEVDQNRRQAEAGLAQAAERHFPGIAAEGKAIVATGAGEAIATYANENGFDLIAMSTHGRSGFRRLVLGSVAEAVLRHSDVPVLLFPKQSS